MQLEKNENKNEYSEKNSLKIIMLSLHMWTLSNAECEW